MNDAPSRVCASQSKPDHLPKTTRLQYENSASTLSGPSKNVQMTFPPPARDREGTGRSLTKKKVFLYPGFPKRPCVAHMFNHGQWWLADGGWWRLAVGGWQLATGGWWRLVAVGGG